MAWEWNGKHFNLLASGRFVNNRTKVKMSPRKTCEFLNFLYESCSFPDKAVVQLYEENEWRKQYQRHLEKKLTRMKEKVRELEVNQMYESGNYKRENR